MKSVKDKILANKGGMTDVNITLTPEEIEHLHKVLHTETNVKKTKELM
jgi:hypothetical protein